MDAAHYNSCCVHGRNKSNCEDCVNEVVPCEKHKKEPRCVHNVQSCEECFMSSWFKVLKYLREMENPDRATLLIERMNIEAEKDKLMLIEIA